MTLDGVSTTDELLERFGYLTTEFGQRYDRVRPRPPAALPSSILEMLGRTRLETVVDLGCGTGLSSEIWLDHSEHVTGIEPSEAMGRVARDVRGIDTIMATAEETTLAANSVDLVTSSNSITWFDPDLLYVELDRILRPAGAFCVYYNSWPPRTLSVVEVAFADHVERIDSFVGRKGGGAHTDIKAAHERLVDDIVTSGVFETVETFSLENSQNYDAARLLGLARSSGTVDRLLREGRTESELGLPQLYQTALAEFGEVDEIPLHFTFSVTIARRGF